VADIIPTGLAPQNLADNDAAMRKEGRQFIDTRAKHGVDWVGVIWKVVRNRNYKASADRKYPFEPTGNAGGIRNVLKQATAE
jgi:hypothetical protein